MKELYIREREVCIDKSMVLWHSQLVFCQYKRHKYGVKLYELCDSSGIVKKILIYSGKQDALTGILGHSGQVVLSLMDEFLDKDYILYTNDYYNSVPLTKAMPQRSTYICGTLRSDEVVVYKWKDKRDVLTISNMHQVEMVDVINRNGKKKSKKPNIVRDYNNGISGIDRSDQMLSYYSCPRKTLCWYKRICLHIFEILIHNAHKVYCKVGNTQMKLVKFRDNVVLCLLGEHIRKETPVLAVDFHCLEAIPPTEKKQRPTKPCRVCTRKKLSKETRYACAQRNQLCA
uniref:PiggyBac transposable element-derived protein domain-containing protein n=1 Tax=Octopus bimaculoides TaxID=37653 RepID=A0A0L8HB68_OCTBM